MASAAGHRRHLRAVAIGRTHAGDPIYLESIGPGQLVSKQLIRRVDVCDKEIRIPVSVVVQPDGRTSILGPVVYALGCGYVDKGAGAIVLIEHVRRSIIRYVDV